MTKECTDFARRNLNEDTARLLLSAARYPDIDMPMAVQQIEGMLTAREKWPSLLSCEDFLYPPRLNREQASSEDTAAFKASLAGPCGRVADLTGGMGIDTLAMSRIAKHVDYVEQDPALCKLMEHNSHALGLGNITVHCDDSMEWLAGQGLYDLVVIDPARRSAAGRKVAAFDECKPDILLHNSLLLSHADMVMVKASPMIDINLALQQLQYVDEVHVVSLHGECKEVLFLCSASHHTEPSLHATLLPSGKTFAFSRDEETDATVHYCHTIGQYLYEPDAALMKAGPFRLICQRWGLNKLAPNTHLYTSDQLVNDFYGRTFHVLREVKPSRKDMAVVIPGGRAHVATRNYPMTAADLQRQLGLKEGGDVFVFATTIGDRRTAFLCRLVQQK